MDSISADSNDACTYDIKAPEKTFKEGAKVMFRLTELKKMRVYMRTGDDPQKAKSLKGRRRLSTPSSFDD